MKKSDLTTRLNAKTKSERLQALRELYEFYKSGELDMPKTGDNVNNHIHTTYSFSPYSPTKAVYMAWKSGLATAGIMDHDSAAGAKEFIEAAKIVSLPITVGLECRCSYLGTPFEGKKFNNPDQESMAYMAIHGIPHHKINEVESFFAPIREKRNERNRKILEKINKRLSIYGISMDFDKDVLPHSEYHDGGTITERTLMYALSAKLIKNDVSKQDAQDNEMARQFLLGIFKSYLIEEMYINADDELIQLPDYIDLCNRIGAIATYPYLGDVGVSVTGDKKSHAYEDSFLEDLLPYVKGLGVRAAAYMPTRNTDEQLTRMMGLCRKYDLFQICGEDINSPMQKFICDKLETPEYSHLIESAWALIGHELLCENDISNGMFADETVNKMPELNKRVEYFAHHARVSFCK